MSFWCCQPLLLSQYLFLGNYLIIGFLTKQWRCCGVLVIFLWIWTCRSLWVLFLTLRQDCSKAGPKDNLSFAVRICYRSWSQSYINSCFDWCDYHLVMVSQFCDVTFVYGESLQWGFGFSLLLFYRMCNRIQGRTPVFGSCLVLIHQMFCFWGGPNGH